MTNITNNEREVINAILNWGGVSIWTECLQDETSIPATSLPGVVSSLAKKGIVSCDGEGSEATVTLINPEAFA